MTRIPLFPLGLVLLPGMPLPLHIFEERYKLMISECLAGDRPFGIVFFDGQAVRSAGCTARVLDVIKEYNDGRLDITTRGERRFVIRELLEEKPYMEARVEFFEDDKETPAAGERSELISTAESLLQQMRKDGFLSLEATPSLSSDPGAMSFTIASLEGFTHDERQKILEMTSGIQRL
jgi:Lon protease-like protein